jgi:Acetyltransferases
MEIKNCTLKDIDVIFRLYKHATDHQKKIKNVVVWPEFSREMVQQEIKEQGQWQLTIDGVIACVWATTFTDAQIWEAKDKDPSVYIHRIATNPKFRGYGFVKLIVKWAKNHAKQHGKSYVRLDTLGNNTKLIAYYKAAGFNFLGLHNLKNTSNLPAHYGTAPVSLFEIKV